MHATNFESNSWLDSDGLDEVIQYGLSYSSIIIYGSPSIEFKTKRVTARGPVNFLSLPN
ncbi:hypothetical protein HanPSC8_Chr09g0350111 [Helianthus annuus]|nr:hypothetical protein HanPSC8_Chr09g0350111 [Helianthus annuus]